MRLAPADLDPASITDALREHFDIGADALEYMPVGGGSHHWLTPGSPFWVTVDDLDRKPWLGGERDGAFDGLRAAFDIAATLRANAREFVVAPLRTVGGQSLLRLSARYALSVFPLLDAEPRTWGVPLVGRERNALVDALAELHLSTSLVRNLARPLPPAFPYRAELEEALSALEEPWTCGPCAEAARALVAAHTGLIGDLVQQFDRLVERAGPTVVITHGEPHAANLMFAPDGRLLLVDWETVGLAPPERDLWLFGDDGEALARYSALTGYAVSPAALKLYRLRWRMDDIATYLTALRAPHTLDAESAHALRALTISLAEQPPTLTPLPTSGDHA